MPSKVVLEVVATDKLLPMSSASFEAWTSKEAILEL
jgi:hypothetical protein